MLWCSKENIPASELSWVNLADFEQRISQAILPLEPHGVATISDYFWIGFAQEIIIFPMVFPIRVVGS